MSKKGEFVYPSCSTCKFKESMKVKTIIERDDGGVHWKHIYEWTVDCKREGKTVDRIEGTAHRAPLPTCSLWRWKHGKENGN